MALSGKEAVDSVTDDKNARAAELALGLLQGRDESDALHEVTVDPEMREAYRIWNERLVTLCGTAEATPDPRVFARIEGVLFAPSAHTDPLSLWDMIRAPENRGLIVAVVGAKAMLLAWILYLFL
ncbi:hypothetical protein [Oceanicola sp. S124]|uniref:hypothetical protein n=1 Tax=Oceanicola sp. S124 TaxID=1042378 RepID=UPI0002557DDE|nr:hypothetical protein [Oceanicola sp. S124]